MLLSSSLQLERDMLFRSTDVPARSEDVFTEQVRLLYDNAYTALLVNLVVASAALVLMMQYVPIALVVTWMAAILIVTSARAMVAMACRRLPATECSPHVWGRRYVYGSLAAGIVWGSIGVLVEVYGSHGDHAFTAFILGGMAAGAIATSGLLTSAYLTFMLPTLLPLNVMLYLHGDEEHLLMGTMTSFFIMVLVITFDRHHRTVYDYIVSRFEKEHALKELEVAHQQLHDITAELAEGLIVLNSSGRVTFMNPEAEHLLGWRMAELGDQKLHDLIHLHGSGEPLQEARCGVSLALQERKVYHREDELFKRRDGNQFPVAYIAAPMSLADGEPAVVVSFQDITTRKAMEEELTRLAAHDALTGLYNRREMERLLDEEVLRSARYQRPLSICMLDVDHFKQVNDTFGHDTGDQILRQLGEKIRQTIRTTDIPTRYGGEEFMVILPETPAADAMSMAERLREHVASTAFSLSDGRELDIRVSIGVASSPEHGNSSMTLLRAADSALYMAKQAGRNRARMA